MPLRAVLCLVLPRFRLQSDVDAESGHVGCRASEEIGCGEEWERAAAAVSDAPRCCSGLVFGCDG